MMLPGILPPIAFFAATASSPASALCPSCHHSTAASRVQSTSRRRPLSTTANAAARRGRRGASVVVRSSSWNDFAYDDEDDVLLSGLPSIVDGDFVPADENDDPSVKAAAGMALLPPEVDYSGPIIEVPQGSELALDEEIVQGVLAACRQEIGTMFGYQAENRGVGITGGVDFVELDGPTVVLRLKGRFWHQRTTVLRRVGAYLMARIPEIVDVVVDDEYELTDEANNLAV
ncbi:hypothetical protein ACHAXA_008594 [Cyclostephanos tholiformis]|uniref:Uncharacterized protein n=1 Tax=Cyclostephanos tholiformis TaxID=382380 RepID=A0ABD3SP66_9STRA